jgi:HD superfamily phosphohydrolase YqeK
MSLSYHLFVGSIREKEFGIKDEVILDAIRFPRDR